MFIENEEQQRGKSNHLHWPTGNSCVTLGAGYDMRERSATEVEHVLRDIGIDASSASMAATGAGLRGQKAK